jgi:hypothetical protein
LIVAAINNLLGNYGNTIHLSHHSNTHQSNDRDVAMLMDELNNGAVGALIVYGANPVYDHWNGKAFADAIKKATVSVSLNDRRMKRAPFVNIISRIIITSKAGMTIHHAQVCTRLLNPRFGLCSNETSATVTNDMDGKYG